MRSLRAARRLFAVAIIAVGGLVAAPSPFAAVTPEQRLAERYAPIMVLKENDDPPCSTSGEQYVPAAVEIVLGNPQVQLVHAPEGKKARVLKTAPTAEDIAILGDDYYLNQRGNPYRPGCTYARDSARLMRGRRPVVYAHIAREVGVPNIALQYWFFYWFNHFNDLHESDWEMIQLTFDAVSPQGALERGPTRIAYAQHAGGETADWDDDKLEKEGTHPKVYVASGSHASQYESALYLGRGRQGAGLGCDDTRGPSYEIRPSVELVLTYPSATGKDAWLNYEGHWGQKARGLSKGPTGPNTKTQWTEPFTWMDGLRTSTPKMPVSESAGTTVTDFFCEAVIGLASLVNYVGNRIWLAGLIVVALIGSTVVPIRRTRWRPVEPVPLRRERATGQLLRAAGVLYWRYAPTLLAISVVIVLLAVAINLALRLLDQYTGVEIRINFAEPGADGFVGLLFAAPAYPLLLVLVGAPIVAVLRRLDAGEPAGAGAAFREVIPRIPRLLLVEILAVLRLIPAILAIVVLTLIGVPLWVAAIIGGALAAKKAVDWTFAGQEVVFNQRKAVASLRASTRLVRGRWWRVATVDVALYLLGGVIGPLAASVLIVLTDAPLWIVNFSGLIWFGLALPYMVLILTLLYLDPRTQAEAPESAWRRLLRHWWRRRPVAVKAEG